MLNRQQAIIWTNADPLHWCIYAARGGDELNCEFYEYCLCQLPQWHFVYTKSAYCIYKILWWSDWHERKYHFNQFWNLIKISLVGKVAGMLQPKSVITLKCQVGVGFGGFSKVVATFNHMLGSFNLFMATTENVWIIPSFQIWGYVLNVLLTHLPWTKWLPFRRQHFQMHFHEWKLLYFDSNFTEVVPKDPIINKSALVQVMAWRRSGDKPLLESMLTQFTDTYMWH